MLNACAVNHKLRLRFEKNSPYEWWLLHIGRNARMPLWFKHYYLRKPVLIYSFDYRISFPYFPVLLQMIHIGLCWFWDCLLSFSSSRNCRLPSGWDWCIKFTGILYVVITTLYLHKGSFLSTSTGILDWHWLVQWSMWPSHSVSALLCRRDWLCMQVLARIMIRLNLAIIFRPSS